MSKISFNLVRSFSVGFTIHSPVLNGLSFEIFIGCFILRYWGKGKKWFGFKNYWASQA